MNIFLFVWLQRLKEEDTRMKQEEEFQKLHMEQINSMSKDDKINENAEMFGDEEEFSPE